LRGLIKLALTSGTLLAGATVAYLSMAHPAPPAPATTATPKATPATQAVVTPAVKPAKHSFRTVMANLGMASWYGAARDGHRTASGELFDKTLLTACHRTLPFGTLVKVIDVASGRSVVVRINDRGVLTPDRIIDLSSGAAEELGILRAGVAKVRLEVLKKVERTATAEPSL
jgi:rare lipoprotein A